jgi:signal peptide peptidase SppA
MYPIITSKVFHEQWAVMPQTHYSIQDALIDRMGGILIQPGHADLQVPFSPVGYAAGLSSPVDRGSRLWYSGSLGVIPVRGIIGSHLSGMEMACGGYGLEQFTADLERASASSLKRIMVDFHSPGGVVTGVPEAAKAFHELGKVKETFGFTSGYSASASMWLMSQAHHNYMTESAGVGSIGVYLALIDKSEGMKARGEKLKLFKAGKYKAMGYPGTSLTEEEEGMLQAQVNKTYARFKADVLRGRPQVDDSAMQGQMFYGKDAREAKLVDSLVTSLASLVKRLS